jgi:hypothetical protein
MVSEPTPYALLLPATCVTGDCAAVPGAMVVETPFAAATTPDPEDSAEYVVPPCTTGLPPADAVCPLKEYMLLAAAEAEDAELCAAADATDSTTEITPLALVAEVAGFEPPLASLTLLVEPVVCASGVPGFVLEAVPVGLPPACVLDEAVGEVDVLGVVAPLVPPSDCAFDCVSMVFEVEADD